MNCPRCGDYYPTNSNFCPNCGYQMRQQSQSRSSQAPSQQYYPHNQREPHQSQSQYNMEGNQPVPPNSQWQQQDLWRQKDNTHASQKGFSYNGYPSHNQEHQRDYMGDSSACRPPHAPMPYHDGAEPLPPDENPYRQQQYYTPSANTSGGGYQDKKSLYEKRRAEFEQAFAYEESSNSYPQPAPTRPVYEQPPNNNYPNNAFGGYDDYNRQVPDQSPPEPQPGWGEGRTLGGVRKQRIGSLENPYYGQQALAHAPKPRSPLLPEDSDSYDEELSDDNYPDKAPFYSRWWFIALSIIIILVGVATCLHFAGIIDVENLWSRLSSTDGYSRESSDIVDDNSSEKVLDSSSHSSSNSLPDAMYGPGVAAQVGDLKITFINADHQAGVGQDRQPEGMEIVKVYLGFANTGANPLTLNPYYFAMMDSSGNISNQIITKMDEEETTSVLLTTQLAAGEEATFYLCFSQPIDEPELVLLYTAVPNQPSFGFYLEKSSI